MLSKADFLKGICGDPVEFELPGIGVVLIKSLTVKDLRTIAMDYSTDEIGAAVATVLYGMVEPELKKEDLPYLEKANPSAIKQLALRIQQLSGLATEDPDRPN